MKPKQHLEGLIEELKEELEDLISDWDTQCVLYGVEKTTQEKEDLEESIEKFEEILFYLESDLLELTIHVN